MLWVLPLGLLILVIFLGVTAWLPSGTTETVAGHDHATHAHHTGTGHTAHNDFFTNYGSYMQRIGCLSTATGEPDWPWIFTLVFLNIGVILAYLRIYVFWTKSYLAEERRDRNNKLMDLAQLFLWCAITGYAAGIVMFVWPAYRLVAVCLAILNIWAWRFAFNLSSFRVAFSAGRYRRLASSDTLTGLPNRFAIREEINRLLNDFHGNDGKAFAVLFLDFDRFKLVNDTLGHEAGDQLLCAIARRLESMFDHDEELSRYIGTPARLGGDEFVIVLKNTSQNDRALSLAQRVVDLFEPGFDLDARSIRSVPSIGVVLANPDYTTADQMLRDADIAMYAAKKNGRSKVVLFDRAMLADVAERMELESDLHHAVERGELTLYYQPLINLESGKIDGFEALARWRHPTRGLVTPACFIPIAEETGIIHGIGAWVFNEAVRQLAAWTASGHGKGWRIHINVSTNQIHDDTLPKRFNEAAHQAGVTPQRLVLEVTESTFTADVETTTKTLNALRDYGFSLAMDDFGTGYSSLSMLHSFPINELKIDRSFIRNLSGRPDYAAVIQAIVSLAENLRIKVVGEGIESPEHVAELQALGCNLAQGFYFSKPLPPEQALAWATQWGQSRASA
jgi:diguanylate cyclase (GGDEF)-like protein